MLRTIAFKSYREAEIFDANASMSLSTKQKYRRQDCFSVRDCKAPRQSKEGTVLLIKANEDSNEGTHGAASTDDQKKSTRPACIDTKQARLNCSSSSVLSKQEMVRLCNLLSPLTLSV
jgi:hypothetical protein